MAAFYLEQAPRRPGLGRVTAVVAAHLAVLMLAIQVNTVRVSSGHPLRETMAVFLPLPATGRAPLRAALPVADPGAAAQGPALDRPAPSLTSPAIAVAPSAPASGMAQPAPVLADLLPSRPAPAPLPAANAAPAAGPAPASAPAGAAEPYAAAAATGAGQGAPEPAGAGSAAARADNVPASTTSKVITILAMSATGASYSFESLAGDEVFKVELGRHSDIQAAIVNHIVEQIRARYPEFIYWDSQGGRVRLSMRPEDHKQTVRFLRHELFENRGL